MSIVLKHDHINGSVEPLLYIDSAVENGYVNEMVNLCIRYIRNELKHECKKDNFIVENANEINEKPNGFWYVIEDNKVVLYKKTKNE